METKEVNKGANLELSMQELEGMEAPGFWTGAAIGSSIVLSIISTATAFT